MFTIKNLFLGLVLLSFNGIRAEFSLHEIECAEKALAALSELNHQTTYITKEEASERLKGLQQSARAHQGALLLTYVYCSTLRDQFKKFNNMIRLSHGEEKVESFGLNFQKVIQPSGANDPFGQKIQHILQEAGIVDQEGEIVNGFCEAIDWKAFEKQMFEENH
jgi:hypothetical protein